MAQREIILIAILRITHPIKVDNIFNSKQFQLSTSTGGCKISATLTEMTFDLNVLDSSATLYLFALQYITKGAIK